MFWYYPVPWLLYLTGAFIVLLIFFPKTVQTLIKTRAFWISGTALFVVGMILLRSENHLMGDGFTHLSNPDRSLAPTEPLDIMLHYALNRLIDSPLLVYQIVTSLAGVFYLYGVFLISRLGRNPLERSIIALAFITTATVQFYFGYVESYKFLNLFTLYYIYFSWRDIKGRKITIFPLLFFLLASLSHFSALALLPSLIYLFRAHLRWYLVAVVAVLVIGGILAAREVGIGKVIVPFLPNEYSPYSLFSSRHVVDIAFEIVLISPLFFLAFWRKTKGKIFTFFLLMLAGTLLFTVLIDPKIGAFRDWDLLATFALPLAALVALGAPRKITVVVVMLVVLTVRISPWLIFNHSLQTTFVNEVVKSDPHYTGQYDEAQRILSWSFLLHHAGDALAAEESFEKFLKYRPGELQALGMLAPLQFNLGKYQKSLHNYLACLEQKPGDINYRYKSIYTAFRAGKYDLALSLLKQSGDDFKTVSAVPRLYAGILAAKGMHQQAVELAERFRDVEDGESYLPYMLAKSYIVAGEYETARRLLNRAITLDSLNQDYRSVLKSIENR